MASALLIFALAVVSVSEVFASSKHYRYTSCKHQTFVKINPPTLIPADELGYSHIVVHPSTRVAHIAGQTALDASFDIQGDTFAHQFPKAADNVELALKAVGASRKDVMTMTIYTVGLSEDERLQTIKWIGVSFGMPAITVVDVKNLAIDGLFVEIEATAAVSGEFCRKLSQWKCMGNTAVLGKVHY